MDSHPLELTPSLEFEKFVFMVYIHTSTSSNHRLELSHYLCSSLTPSHMNSDKQVLAIHCQLTMTLKESTVIFHLQYPCLPKW